MGVHTAPVFSRAWGPRERIRTDRRGRGGADRGAGPGAGGLGGVAAELGLGGVPDQEAAVGGEAGPSVEGDRAFGGPKDDADVTVVVGVREERGQQPGP